MKDQTMMMISQSITLKIYLWDGMENLFLTGFTSSTVLVLNSNVRFVEVHLIGVVVPLKDTSKNGDTLME
jgi:membrane protein YqaA with SNARE-associated domain